jgi:hypothetical protein
MGIDIEGVDGTRIRMYRDGKHYYIWVSDEGVMFSGPGEGDVGQQELYTMVNAICRVSSKMLECGFSWEDILTQWKESNMSNNSTFLSQMGILIDELYGLDVYTEKMEEAA